MLLYHQTAAPASLWPEPIETTWQMLPGRGKVGVRWKRPDITLSDRLFMGAVANIPHQQRPWGSITWLADVYDTSRETLYAIGRQVRDGLLPPPEKAPFPMGTAAPGVEPASSALPTIAVTDNRLNRTILTMLLPVSVGEDKQFDREIISQLEQGGKSGVRGASRLQADSPQQDATARSA